MMPMMPIMVMMMMLMMMMMRLAGWWKVALERALIRSVLLLPIQLTWPLCHHHCHPHPHRHNYHHHHYPRRNYCNQHYLKIHPCWASISAPAENQKIKQSYCKPNLNCELSHCLLLSPSRPFTASPHLSGSINFPCKDLVHSVFSVIVIMTMPMATMMTFSAVLWGW